MKLLLTLTLLVCLKAQDSQLNGTPLSGGVGVQLSSASVITKISFQSSGDTTLGVFEGANDQSFMDGVPLYMFTGAATGEVTVNVDKGFKYVRYVGKGVSNLQLYGHSASGDGEKGYQPTKIPLVAVHTEGSRAPADKNNEINCNVVIVSDGKITTNAKAAIRLRGNSTLNLQKKAYRIKFEEKTNVLSLPAKAKKWTLLANTYDRSLLRNKIAYKVGELIGLKYSPQCESVDLMLNGEYMGNYLLCDQVEVGDGRLEIAEMDKTATSEPDISGGYLLEIDGNANKEKSHFNSAQGVLVTIKYPKEDNINSQQSAYIKQAFDKAESNVYAGNADGIDIDSFSKWFLAEEFCGNIDTTWSSTYVFKEKGDNNIHWGPVWDLDLALDNDVRLYPTNDKTTFCYTASPSAGTAQTFLTKILSIEKVLQAVKEEWNKAKSSTIAPSVLEKFISEEIAKIKDSAQLNFKKWPILNQKLAFEPQLLGSVEAEANYVKDFISKRYQALSTVLESRTTSNVGEKSPGGGGFPWGGGGGWGGGGWGGGGQGGWPQQG